MLRKIYNMLNRRNTLFTIIASTLMLLLLVSSAVADIYGTQRIDRNLDNRFRDYEVLQDYNYYTSGGYDRPNAILLIHKDYELDNPGNLWVSIPYVDYNQMRKWVSVISSEQDAKRSGNYYATYLLDQSGNKVGVWYSIEVFATVKFVDGDKILVYTPQLRQGSILGDL